MEGGIEDRQEDGCVPDRQDGGEAPTCVSRQWRAFCVATSASTVLRSEQLDDSKACVSASVAHVGVERSTGEGGEWQSARVSSSGSTRRWTGIVECGGHMLVGRCAGASAGIEGCRAGEWGTERTEHGVASSEV